jgi:hypothetical protein
MGRDLLAQRTAAHPHPFSELAWAAVEICSAAKGEEKRAIKWFPF